MASLETLLAVQGHDTVLTQLLHRRTHLPEQAELAEVQRQLAVLETAAAPTHAAHDDLVAREDALEAQVAAIDTKIAQVSAHMYSGTVSVPRELQGMEADIASLRKRRSELEDTELGLMLEREPIDAQLEVAAEQRKSLDKRAGELLTAIAEALVILDADANTHVTQRAAEAAGIPADLLSQYERIRTRNNGVGIARLEHGTCMSCRLKLSAMEMDRIKSMGPNDVALCEECGAILFH